MDFRPLSLDDTGAVHQLIRRWETHWKAPMVTPIDEVVEDLGEPHLDIDRDTIGAWDGGELVGYGWIWHRPSGERIERAHAIGHVDPDHRGRGIGRQLFGWQVDRGSEILSAIPNDLPKYLRADDWDWIDESHRLYRRFGMEPVRYFTGMLRELDGPVEVAPIDGVTIVPYDRAHDDDARVTLNEAFADHWGSTPVDPASSQHRLEGKNTRLDLSFLAMADHEVVGVTLNANFPEDEALLGRREGWIEALGVKRAWRNRGIATALINASCNAFLSSGLTHAALGVDAANPTGALGLYTGLGFVPTQRSILSEKEIRSV